MKKEYSLSFSSPVELADFIQAQPAAEQLRYFKALAPENAVTTFEYLPLGSQKELLKRLPHEQVADLLNHIAPDDRTALLQELPSAIVSQLLKYLSAPERELSIKLLGYPEGSVGRLMTPDFISIRLSWTVKHALDHIREKGKDSETINVVYAVDSHGVLVDDFRIRQLLLAPLGAKVEELADFRFVALHVDEDVGEAINTFRRNDRVALPVLDSKNVMLGIVTFDDIMKAATKEDTEDFQKMGGVQAFDLPYMQMPLFALIRKRIGWLVILFLGELLTASAMGYFQDEIAKAIVLTLFVPLIISSGGNSGSQASTLIIRAMALGEVRLSDWWRVMRREVIMGLVFGIVLGAIGFFRVSVWSLFSTIYGAEWFLIALTVFFSLIGVVLWGTLMGAMLPLVLRRAGFDPAASSTPFVATIVDVTGLVIYFSVAYVVLQGTLL